MRRTAFVGATVAAGVVAYRRWVAPWQQHWGASDDETSMLLPGDELLREPADQVTRAVTIQAEPAQVWPWLVQLGADRGGFYSYDWLEDLFGLAIHSADTIVPEWQDLEVGDLVAAARSRSGGWQVVALVPGEALVLQLADMTSGKPVRREQGGWEFQWMFALRPLAGGATRLLVRERVAFGSSRYRVLMAPLGPVSFVMTRRMLLGIKARAERRSGLQALA
jgi:hypothetical protein